tara:strand:+ start:51 stop:248 length:198 start_codon:yes stop_codon:yes gene_type:complete
MKVYILEKEVIHEGSVIEQVYKDTPTVEKLLQQGFDEVQAIKLLDQGILSDGWITYYYLNEYEAI